MIRRLALLGLITIACRSAERLSDLARDLNKEFPDTPIGVSLTDQILLNLSTTDSMLSLAPCADQVGFALRLARSLPQHYADVAGLQVVSVTFDAPVHAARLPIRFSPAAVKTGLQSQDSVKAVESCVSFEELNNPAPNGS